MGTSSSSSAQQVQCLNQWATTPQVIRLGREEVTVSTYHEINPKDRDYTVVVENLILSLFNNSLLLQSSQSLPQVIHILTIAKYDYMHSIFCRYTT